MEETQAKLVLRCRGTIRKKDSKLYGKKCRKFLAEANYRGHLKCKIKCPRCGYINNVNKSIYYNNKRPIEAILNKKEVSADDCTNTGNK